MKRSVWIMSFFVASSILLVLVTSVGARPMPLQSPLPPVCPKGQTCDGSYLPWRPTPGSDQPANHKDKEPTATPAVTPQLTVRAVQPVLINAVTRRVTRLRSWRR